VLTIAYFNTVWNVDEFSAMDYNLNIVSKCCFFFIFKHLQAPKGSWKIFSMGPVEKSWIFVVSKRVGTLALVLIVISRYLQSSVAHCTRARY